MKNFNPKVTDFMTEHPNLTVIGLVWAGWWRLYVAILVVAFAINILLAVLNG